MEKHKIEDAIEVLKICQYVWADQIPNDGQCISDSDAIDQSINCLREWSEA